MKSNVLQAIQERIEKDPSDFVLPDLEHQFAEWLNRLEGSEIDDVMIKDECFILRSVFKDSNIDEIINKFPEIKDWERYKRTAFGKIEIDGIEYRFKLKLKENNVEVIISSEELDYED